MSEDLQQPGINPNAKIRMTYGELQKLVGQVVRQSSEASMVKNMGEMHRSGDSIELHPENHSPILPPPPTHEMWLWFLQEVEIMKLTNVLNAAESPSAATVIPGLFLPALLLVKLVSIFDEALDKYIDENRLSMPMHPYRTLDRRLKFLDGQGAVQYTQTLRDVKDARNRVGHRPTTPANWQSGQVTWATLENAISVIENVLQSLNMVGQRPAYEGFAARDNQPVSPDRPELYMTLKYSYGIKEGGKVVMQFVHSFDYHRLPWWPAETNADAISAADTQP